jgi:hypothetical protein
VDQADLDETTGVGGVQVLVDDRTDVGRAEGVEVEGVLDRDPDGSTVVRIVEG